MKITPMLLIPMLSAGLAAFPIQPKQQHASREFMREKLALSQSVLEGLATEDYSLIAAKATRLSAMSNQADWRIVQSPEYDQQSIFFRQQVDALKMAAKNKNLDAATLAYVRMTMSCVDCHKLVRGKLVAMEAPTPPQRLVYLKQTTSQP
jgi:hypothetical protein